MKAISKLFLALAALLAALALPAHAAGKLKIITSIPDLAEFAREIGGDLVEVESLATGVEDPHGIPLKPSFATKLNRADAVIAMGLGYEHSYLPALLEASRNPRILPGKPGYIDTSRGLTPRDVPADLSRAQGETHPEGNPHYNLDPVAGRLIVQNIAAGLTKVAPHHADAFARGRDAYLAKLDAKIAEWTVLAAPLKGMKFVSYHSHWPYFANRFGLESAGTIESRPGIEPGARHLKELIERMKAGNVKLVVREPQFPEKTPNQVAAQAGSKVVKLAIMVGGTPEAKTYLALIESNLRALVAAAK